MQNYILLCRIYVSKTLDFQPFSLIKIRNVTTPARLKFYDTGLIPPGNDRIEPPSVSKHSPYPFKRTKAEDIQPR